MIISINPPCRKDKIKQDGTTLIYIRSTHNRIRPYQSTGITSKAMSGMLKIIASGQIRPKTRN
ncbi:hypothetical protein [Alistipes sp.]|uniref:hypothetical protein n=1 Tax=Alistipes sp. TaxID=1872444 RepID=UPI003AF12FF0